MSIYRTVPNGEIAREVSAGVGQGVPQADERTADPAARPDLASVRQHRGDTGDPLAVLQQHEGQAKRWPGRQRNRRPFVQYGTFDNNFYFCHHISGILSKKITNEGSIEDNVVPVNS